MVRPKCSAITASGSPCKGFALPGEAYCYAHHPEKRQAYKEAQRRGGENRSTYRRAARLWAANGREVDEKDLPAMVRALIVEVRAGKVEPSVALAIAQLAKAAASLTTDVDLVKRIEALEAAAGSTPAGSNIRRIV